MSARNSKDLRLRQPQPYDYRCPWCGSPTLTSADIAKEQLLGGKDTEELLASVDKTLLNMGREYCDL